MNCRVERNIDGVPVSVKQGEYQDLKNRAQFSDIEFISALAKVAEDDISELGSGDFGTAYSLGDGRVAKLTSSRGEAEVSLRQMQIQAEGAVKIHEVYRDGRSYVIIQEEVDTDSSIEDDFGLLLNLLASQNLPIQYLNYLDYDELSEEDKSDYDSIEDFIQGIENVNWAYRQLGVEASDIKYDNLGYNEQGELVAFDLDDRRGDRNTPFEGNIKTAMEVIHENEFRNTSSEMSSIEAEKFHIIERAKKYGTYLKAPNGAETNLSPEQWVETRTTAFKEWFGDWELDPDNASKVVDENGEPLILYHGTPETRFDTFDRKKGTQRDSGLKEFGNWFTSNKEVAKAYQGEGGIIYSVYLNLKSMPEFNVRGKNYYDGRWDIKADLGYKYARGAEAIEAMAGKNRMVPNAQVDGLKVKSVIDLEGTVDTKYMGDSYLVMDDTIDGIKIIDVEGESSKVQDIKSKVALGEEIAATEETETLNRPLTETETKTLLRRLERTKLATSITMDAAKMQTDLEARFGEGVVFEQLTERVVGNEIQFLKTTKGDILGYVTPEGHVFLDPNGMTAETPIHEFTHLWNRIIQQTDPALWNEIVEVTQQTELWNVIKDSSEYQRQFEGKEGQELTDAIADEVWAQMVGVQGAQTWQDTIDRLDTNKSLGQRILQAIRDFWSKVVSWFSPPVKISDYSLQELQALVKKDLEGDRTMFNLAEKYWQDLAKDVNAAKTLGELNTILKHASKEYLRKAIEIKAKASRGYVLSELMQIYINDESNYYRTLRSYEIEEKTPVWNEEMQRWEVDLSNEELAPIIKKYSETLQYLRMQRIHSWENSWGWGALSGAARYLATRSLFQEFRRDRQGLPIAYLGEPFRRTIEAFNETNSPTTFNWYQEYRNKSVEWVMEDNPDDIVEVISEKDVSGKWIKLSKGTESKNIGTTIMKVQVLSNGQGWCTNSFGAKKVIQEDNHDFYMFVPEGKFTASVAIATIQEGQEDQLKTNTYYTGVFDERNSSDNSILPSYYDAVNELLKKTKDPDIIRTLNETGYTGLTKEEMAAITKEKEKVKIDWFEANKNRDTFSTEEDFEHLQSQYGILLHKREDGFTQVHEVTRGTWETIPGSIREEFTEKLLNSIDVVEGIIDFKGTTVTHPGRISNVGTILLEDSEVSSLGNIVEIRENAYLEFSELEDLGKLERVGGLIYLQGTHVTTLGNLQYVGEYLFFNSNITSLGNLRTVGMSLTLPEHITSLGKLESVGASLTTSDNGDLQDWGNLKYVGETLYIEGKVSPNIDSLEYIGTQFTVESSSEIEAKQLKYVGGDMYLQDTHVKNLDSLEYVGGEMDISGSDIVRLDKLKAVGGELDLGKTGIKRLDALQVVKGSIYGQGAWSFEGFRDLQIVVGDIDIGTRRTTFEFGKLESIEGIINVINVETGANFNSPLGNKKGKTGDESRLKATKLIDNIENSVKQQGAFSYEIRNTKFTSSMLQSLQGERAGELVDITLNDLLSGRPIDTTPTQTTSETIETWGDNISDTVLSKMYESGEIQMTNEEGIICAENGVTSSLTQGGTWSVVKHFKGNSHAQGGIDIVVTDGKVKMSNKQGEFKAKDGVQLPKFSIRQVVGRIKNIGKPDYSDMSRGEAFHQARQDLGTGQTFVHKGTRYSTTTADEQNKDVKSTFKTGAIPTTKIAQVIKETRGQKNTNEPMDIDLTGGTLAYSTTGENVGGNLILGGDYVEKEPTALPAYEYKNRKDKIVLNSQKKDYIENDSETQRFYGIVDGKLKTGLAKEFKDYDVIVPVRWGGRYDQLDEQGEYEHMFYREGEPVYSSGDRGKVLLHSPSSGQTRFLYYNEAGDVRKKSQEFLKANPDAEYISMDTGRFNYLVGGEDIELDEKHYKYFYNSDFDRGHGKGYNLVYTYPKK